MSKKHTINVWPLGLAFLIIGIFTWLFDYNYKVIWAAAGWTDLSSRSALIYGIGAGAAISFTFAYITRIRERRIDQLLEKFDKVKIEEKEVSTKSSEKYPIVGNVVGYLSVPVTIAFASGLSISYSNDPLTVVSIFLGSISIGLSIAIFAIQQNQGAQIKSLNEDIRVTTLEIQGYVTQQKKKEKLIQADYARNLIFLINWSRMKIHGMNIQINFLKKILPQPFSPQRIEDERIHRDIFHQYVIELQDIMSRNKITPDMILEIFDDKTQLLFLTMWKMFSSARDVVHLNENYYDSLMTHFIDTGLKSSEELYNILIEYLPEAERNKSSLESVEIS